MRAWQHIGLLALAATIGVSPVRAQNQQSWSFTGIERIELEGTSGDLQLQAATGAQFELQLIDDTSPAGAFRGEVNQDGKTLHLRERWMHGSSSGNVRWILAVPSGAQPLISMDSASGGVDAEGITARFQIDTASGDFELRDGAMVASDIDTASGDLELTQVTVAGEAELSTASGDVDLDTVTASGDFGFSTASGDITVRNCEGIHEGSSASGDVHVYASDLAAASKFSSASGNVTVELTGTLQQPLELSSASGNVELTAAFGDDFTLVMSARQDSGRIRSPFEYTAETSFERHGQRYDRKTVAVGSGTPEITLRTASGSVTVRRQR